MNRGRMLLILVLLTCSLTYPIALTSGEDFMPLLRVAAREVYLTAGEETQIEVEIRNMGSFNVYEVEVLLSVSPSAPGISITDGAHMIFNKIEDGKAKVYHPTIYVNRETPLGTYMLTCQVSYLKKFKIGAVQPHSIAVPLGIVVDNVSKPRIKLNVEVEDGHLRAGTEEEISVAVENIGEETVYEVDATIASTTPYIAVLEGARSTCASLDANSSVTYLPIVAVSRNAPLGVYTLTATASYEDRDGRGHLDTFPLGINVDSVEVAEQTAVVLSGFEVKPDVVTPGGSLDLELELECLGAEAHDVKALISFDPVSSLSPLSPTLVDLGDLEPNGTSAVIYRLLVDGGGKAGQQPVRITLSYLDSNGVPRSTVETVTIRVDALVSFTLLNTAEMVVEMGDVADLDADLLLIGTESVDFVQIDVVEGGPFEKDFESHEYIGPVDPDSPVPFDIHFAIGAGVEAGDYVLSLNVTYFDDLNRVRWSIVRVPVSVVEPPVEVEAQVSPLGGFWLWLRRLFGILP